MGNSLFNEDEGWISLKYLKRYPNTPRTREFKASVVAIQSDNGYWREQGAGYAYRRHAAAYVGEDAFQRTQHCGHEKKVKYHLYDKISYDNRERQLKAGH